MHIWHWLSKFSAPLKHAVIRNVSPKVDPHEVLYLLDFMDLDGRYSKFSNIETIAKHVLKKAEEVGDYLTKVLAHKVLGRLFFEKGMFASALAQFERALDSFEMISDHREADELNARLHAWVGLSALRTNEYTKAINSFKIAIRFLEKNQENKFVVGELKALLGDALSFTKPESALAAFEEAHELMKQAPSVIFISNGLKLFSALVFRKYFREASSILSEVGENIFRAIKGMNLGVFQSIKKIYRGPFLKALRVIKLKEKREIIDLLYGLEGIKGIYFLFRYFLKPLIRIKDLANYNQAILIASRLMNHEYIDEIISKKNRFLRIYDQGNFASYRLKGKYSLARYPISINALMQEVTKYYRRVMIISLVKLDIPQEYKLIALEFPSEKALIHRINLDVDDIIYDFKQGKEINMECSTILTSELENMLSNYDKQDVVLFSLDGLLHQLPWESLYFSKSNNRLGLVTNVIRIPTLMHLALWERSYYGFRLDKVAVLESLRRKKYLKDIFNILRKKGYKIYRGDSLDINYLVNEHINFLLVISYMRDLMGDEIFVQLGGSFFSIKDIEKLDLSGDLMFLMIPDSIEIYEDNVADHNLPESFLISGFKSIFTMNAGLEERESELLMKEFSNIVNNGVNSIGDIALELRRKIYSLGKKWWQHILLYGSPLVSV